MEKKQKGFTLIEMMVSISLFSIVMTMSFGALLTIMDANNKAKTIKIVVNNLNMAMESMSRELRMGKSYTCRTASSPDGHDTNGGIDGSNCESVAFYSSNRPSGDEDVKYTFINNTIMRKVGTEQAHQLVGSDISIEQMGFWIGGTNPGGDQPRVIIALRGSIARAGVDSKFNIQTSISQRDLES